MVVAAAVLHGLFLLAEEATQAKVRGPQSTVEQYNPPIVESDADTGEIDFPKMIAEPTANDGVELLKELKGLKIEILGTQGTEKISEFLLIQGNSKASEKLRTELYTKLNETLTIYQDQPLTLGDLRHIQQDITDVYKETGFPLMSVVAPPQEISKGVVKIHVNEFKLQGFVFQFKDNKEDAYSADTKHWSNDARIARILNPLLNQAILSQKSLDKKVKHLNQNPFRSARVLFEPGQGLGDVLATIQIDEKRPWGFNLGYNNHATEASGTYRYSLGANIGNLLFEDHQISTNVTVSPDPSEFVNYSLSYVVPNRFGHTMTASVNYSDTASSIIPGIGTASRTIQSSLAYNAPIWSNDFIEWSSSLTASYKQFERDSLFGGAIVGGSVFDSAQLNLNNRFNIKEPTASNQFTFGAVYSFEGITGRNSNENFREFYNRAQGGAKTMHYTLSYARIQQLDILYKNFKGWNTETQLSFQFSGDDLAGSDQFASGGPGVLRAYDSSAVSGNDGYYWQQFLHIKPFQPQALGTWMSWLQQVSVSPFIESAHTDDAKIWDYGVQISGSLIQNANISFSMAQAQKAVNDTKKGDWQGFVSVNWQY